MDVYENLKNAGIELPEKLAAAYRADFGDEQ